MSWPAQNHDLICGLLMLCVLAIGRKSWHLGIPGGSILCEYFAKVMFHLGDLFPKEI